MTGPELITSLRRRLDEVLAPLIPAGRPCAVVGFPRHVNVGDSVIWLAQRAALRRAGARIVHVCDRENYDRAELASRLPTGTIFIHGGGSLGDVWWRGQSFREQIIGDFPDHRIVQLPQSIHFRDRTALERARAVFDAHPDLTILTRDHRSFAQARRVFKARTLLCPDVAVALGPLPRAAPPATDLVWLARTDRESAWPDAASLPGVPRMDWRDEPPWPIARAARWALGRAGRRGHLRRLERAGRLVLYDVIARSRLAWGRRLLSRGRVVITDRLHGYLLSLLQGIPHVLLDTRYGKVRAFYETWGEGCGLTHWASSPEDAAGVARALVA